MTLQIISSLRDPPARIAGTVRDVALAPGSSRPAQPSLEDLPRGDANVEREGASPEGADLMERVRQGDARAFERLVERFWKRTLVYAHNLTGDQDGALDVTQEAFARLWKKRSDWVASGSVRNWLLRTARNMVLSEQRKVRVRSAWSAQAPEAAGPGPRTPLQDLERTELRQAIIDAVQKLPARRREAFTLFHLQGLSYRETAEIMMVREQTVANYLQAALSDLRVSLAPFFPAAGSSGSPEESPQDEVG